MRLHLAVGVMVSVLWWGPVSAQNVDPNVVREVGLVYTGVAGNNEALRQYTWTEHTEVLVKGEVKSSTALTCRYDGSGKLVKTPPADTNEQDGKAKKDPSAMSNKPRVRKKADMQDYIERAISLIHVYVPLKPDQLQLLLQRGSASLGKAEGGKSEIRLVGYFQGGDSLVFTYDPVSKALLHASIKSTMGSPKDPVTLDAVFETLPDGVNHLASTILNAPNRKVQVKTRNDSYQKAANQ